MEFAQLAKPMKIAKKLITRQGSKNWKGYVTNKEALMDLMDMIV